MPAAVPHGGGQTKHKSTINHTITVAGPLIAKADELPVHNRKGLGNQKEKGGGDVEAGGSSFSTLGHTLRVSGVSDILYNQNLV